MSFAEREGGNEKRNPVSLSGLSADEYRLARNDEN